MSADTIHALNEVLYKHCAQLFPEAEPEFIDLVYAFFQRYYYAAQPTFAFYEAQKILFKAVERGYVGPIKFIFDIARQVKTEDVVEKLMTTNAVFSLDDHSPPLLLQLTLIEMVCSCLKTDILDLFIHYGLNIKEYNFLNIVIDTEFEASESQKFKMLEKLLDLGMKIDFQDYNKRTALHCAVLSGKENSVGLLLSGRADPNPQDKKGRTPLHLAITLGNIEIITLLLTHGADVNLKDKEGNTPLHHAVLKRDANLVRILLERDAKMNIANKKKKTPYAIAKKLSDRTIIELFVNHAMEFKGSEDENEIILDYLEEGRSRMKQQFGSFVALPSSQSQKDDFKKMTEEELKSKLRKCVEKISKERYICCFVESGDTCTIEISHPDFFVLSSAYVLLLDNQVDGTKLQYSNGKIILNLPIDVDRADILSQFLLRSTQYHQVKSKIISSLSDILKIYSLDRNKILSVEPEQNEEETLFFKISYRIDKSDSAQKFKKSSEEIHLNGSAHSFQKSFKFQEEKSEGRSEGILILTYHRDLLFDGRKRKIYCELLAKPRCAVPHSSGSSTPSPQIFLTALLPGGELAPAFKRTAQKEKTSILFKIRGHEGYCLYRPKQDEEVVFLVISEKIMQDERIREQVIQAEGIKMANSLGKNISVLVLLPREIVLLDRITHDYFAKGRLLKLTQADFYALPGPSGQISFSELLEKLDDESSYLFRANLHAFSGEEETHFKSAGIEKESSRKQKKKQKKKETQSKTAGKKEKEFDTKSETPAKPTSFVQPVIPPLESFQSRRDAALLEEEWVKGPNGNHYPAGMVPLVPEKKQKSSDPEKRTQEKLELKLKNDVLHMSALLSQYQLSEEGSVEQACVIRAMYYRLIQSFLTKIALLGFEIQDKQLEPESDQLRRRQRRWNNFRNYFVHYFGLYPLLLNERRKALLLYLAEFVKNEFEVPKGEDFQKSHAFFMEISTYEVNISSKNTAYLKILSEAEEKYFQINFDYLHVHMTLMNKEAIIARIKEELAVIKKVFKSFSGKPQAFAIGGTEFKSCCASMIILTELISELVRQKVTVNKSKLNKSELNSILSDARIKIRNPAVHESESIKALKLELPVGNIVDVFDPLDLYTLCQRVYFLEESAIKQFEQAILFSAELPLSCDPNGFLAPPISSSGGSSMENEVIPASVTPSLDQSHKGF